MTVFANGFPKSGNYALVKALQLLGVPCEVNHRPFADGLPKGTTHHVLIVRDPRDVLVSWLRFNGQPVTPGMFIAAFRKFDRVSLVEEMQSFLPWLNNEATYAVRYEDLIEDDRAMRDIATAIGVPYLEGAWQQLPNHTRTWNPIRSNYLDVWTKEVIAAWYDEGGGDLLRWWGY